MTVQCECLAGAMAAPDFTATVDLPAPDLREVLEATARVAIGTGQIATIVGVRGHGMLISAFACCRNTPGSLTVVPDVAALEATANGVPLPAAPSVIREDGRRAWIFEPGQLLSSVVSQ